LEALRSIEMTHRGSNDAQEGIAVARGLTVKGRVATSLGLAAACVAVVAGPAVAHTYDPTNPYGDATAVYGRRAVLGVPGADGNTGILYQYRFGTTGWKKMATFVPGGIVAGDSFGAALAFDGNFVLAGAPGKSSGEGTVSVISHLNGRWGTIASAHATAPQAGAHFGQAIALSGLTVAIGAPGAAVAGSVTLGSLAPSGVLVKSTVQAPTPTVGDGFGTSVALGSNTLVVGAPGANGGQGAAYLYHFAAHTWHLIATLGLSSPAVGNAFGQSVAVSGAMVAVGAPGRTVDGHAGAGVVATFNATNGTAGAVLTEATPTAGRHLGRSLSGFATTLAAGAPGDTGVNGGATLFTEVGGTWSVASTLTSSSSHNLGWAVGAGRGTSTIGPHHLASPLLVVVTGRTFSGVLGA
jgi:hypothetical protein